jgi:hypothetical protein
MVVAACMIGSSKCGSINSTHIHGTHVPVEEPSTASKADILRSPLRVRRENVIY